MGQSFAVGAVVVFPMVRVHRAKVRLNQCREIQDISLAAVAVEGKPIELHAPPGKSSKAFGMQVACTL